MTSLKKLKENLNLVVLSSNETICLKGGQKLGDFGSDVEEVPIKPIKGFGIPPRLSSEIPEI